jgi:hypothetical protein
MESNRRAMVYDTDQHSYLFTVTDTFNVDSTLKGNKMRFANHKSHGENNCFVAYIKVNNDPRIAMYAQ